MMMDSKKGDGIMAQKTIQIADKVTLDKVLTGIESVKALLSSSESGGSDGVATQLIDYKTFGKNSYVYCDKDVWNAFCNSKKVANDKDVYIEAFKQVIANNQHIGNWLAWIYRVENKDELKKLTTLDAVAASSTAMNAVIASSTAMNAVIASSTAMNAVVASSTAYKAMADNNTAVSALSQSAIALNAICKSAGASTALEPKFNASYRANIWNTLMNATNFTKEQWCTGDRGNVFGTNKFNTRDTEANLYTGNTITLIGYYQEDGDTTNRARSLATNVYYVNTKSSATNTYVASSYPGVCFRGVQVYHSGSSVYALGFYTFTAK